MKLAGMHIGRFGARSDLNLSNVADHLNVIYGPNGSGKSTIIQFIRWMLFGQPDEVLQRYLTTNPIPSRGTLDVRDHQGLRTLERTNVDSLHSHLTIHGPTHDTQLPTTLSNAEFDRFFTICFDQPHSVADLCSSVTNHGFKLSHDQRRLDRIQQLEDQIARHRTELSQFGYLSETADVLRDRQEGKLCEINSIRSEHHRSRKQLEQQRNQVDTEVSQQQRLVERLHSVVVNIDTAIQNRKQRLTQEYQQCISVRRESTERRDRRVSEIDAQATRWQEILQKVRQRLDQVRSRMSSFGEVAISPTEATDIHFFLRTLGVRIRDIEHDLGGIYENDVWRDHEADATYLRGLLGSALNSTREDVARLCQTVERQQQSNELRECREELNSLCRTEQELSDLIATLSRQRHQFSRKSEFWPSGFDAELLDQYAFKLETGYKSSDDATARVAATSPSLPVDLANGLNDFRLQQLMHRRFSADARHRDAEFRLLDHQRKLRDIEETIAGLVSDGRIAALERDMAEIDRVRRQLEQQTAVQHSISSLEDELGHLRRDQLDQSPVVDEASAIMGQLSNNEYGGIRVFDGDRCQVTDRVGKTLDYQQLSRGVQDQVCLSLNIAIVAAYRRKGIEAPLILNDVFADLDQSGARELVDVLVDFAQRGQQILLFTRHEHIRQSFEKKVARIFSLVGRDERVFDPATVVTPTVFALPIVATSAEIPPGSPDPTYHWIAEWQRRPESHPLIPTAPAPRPKPEHTEPPPPNQPINRIKRDGEPADARPVVSLTSLLTEVPTIDAELIGYLEKLHLSNVSELLKYDPHEAETHLGKHGITAEIIKRRQREILMMVHLAVSPLEAQLLVACGVPDPDRLGRADEVVLLKRIETILARPQATERFGSVSDYSLARMRRWIGAAQRSNYRGRSRRSSFNLPAAESRSSTRKSSRGNDTVHIQSKPDMKFYLDVNDPVVDAPSIGLKTAQKLNENDIYTVRDLLDLEASTIAARLGDRRIGEETITQWQFQAQLVCCIPNLRSHDSQILVACGIEEPATLSSLDASTFFEQVKGLVDSKKGQRIIRNSKKPDLAEVTAWIQWANSARQLKAA